MKVVSCFCLHSFCLSGLYLSVLFAAPPFTCYPLLHCKGLINDLKENDALTFHLPCCFCITGKKIDPTEKHSLPLARLELSPELALHWLFIRQTGDERISAASGDMGIGIQCIMLPARLIYIS